MGVKKYNVGTRISSKSFGDFVILEELPDGKVLLQFVNTGYEVAVSRDKMRARAIKDLLAPTVYGRGFIGSGKHNNKTSPKAYKRWLQIFERCYSEKLHKKFPTYSDCSVYKEWWNFQNFAEWYSINSVPNYELDKDILSLGNRVYHPEFCVFVPKEINMLFSYKQNPSRHLPRGVAKHPKSKGRYISTCGFSEAGNYGGAFDTIEQARENYITNKNRKVQMVAEKYNGLVDERVIKVMLSFDIAQYESVMDQVRDKLIVI